MKVFVKACIPPILIKIIRKIRGERYGWKGCYHNWQDAKAVSTGYDEDVILKKVKTALLKVKKGQAVYERDGVVFEKIQYSWPLTAALLLSAVETGELRVLDFGGSLGSTYFQNKIILNAIKQVSWSIIEQKHFVNVGRKEFADDKLHFYYDYDTCIKEQQPNILILSSILQYVEKPYDLLNEILQYNFDYILIDRTPFRTKGSNDVIKLQQVAPSIYSASYPCWFFNDTRFKEYFKSRNYIIIDEFETVEGKTDTCHFRGMILRKNENL
ncbi:TIGR04325 family methyltransferase [Verrucomicrobiota bacterium]